MQDVVVLAVEDRLAPELVLSLADEDTASPAPATTAPSASTASGTSITGGLSCACLKVFLSARVGPWKVMNIRRQE